MSEQRPELQELEELKDELTDRIDKGHHTYAIGPLLVGALRDVEAEIVALQAEEEGPAGADGIFRRA